MGILDGKTILVTGIITDASIAFSTARWPRSRVRR